MDRASLKRNARDQLSKNIEALILCNFLFFCITSLSTIIQQLSSIPALFSQQQNSSTTAALPSGLLFVTWPISIAIMLFTPALEVGLRHVYLKSADYQKPRFTEMFKHMDQFGNAFVTSLLAGIFTILQFLLLIVPGIMAAYSYSMIYLVLAEHPKLSAMEAIKESKRIMRGHRWELFVLQISFIWWYLLILITFGLAAIYVSPYIAMAETNFYNKIKNTQE